MFQGLRTAIYHVPDLDQAKAWYTSVLGIQPYFDQPFYVGFNIGGFELALDPDMTNVVIPSTGVIVYWGVDNIDTAFQRLIEHGAKEHGAVQDVGDNIRTATVTDPFGNVLGIIENPHFTLGN